MRRGPVPSAFREEEKEKKREERGGECRPWIIRLRREPPRGRGPWRLPGRCPWGGRREREEKKKKRGMITIRRYPLSFCGEDRGGENSNGPIVPEGGKKKKGPIHFTKPLGPDGEWRRRRGLQRGIGENPAVTSGRGKKKSDWIPLSSPSTPVEKRGGGKPPAANEIESGTEKRTGSVLPPPKFPSRL